MDAIERGKVNFRLDWRLRRVNFIPENPEGWIVPIPRVSLSLLRFFPSPLAQRAPLISCNSYLHVWPQHPPYIIYSRCNSYFFGHFIRHLSIYVHRPLGPYRMCCVCVPPCSQIHWYSAQNCRPRHCDVGLMNLTIVPMPSYQSEPLWFFTPIFLFSFFVYSFFFFIFFLDSLSPICASSVSSLCEFLNW